MRIVAAAVALWSFTPVAHAAPCSDLPSVLGTCSFSHPAFGSVTFGDFQVLNSQVVGNSATEETILTPRMAVTFDGIDRLDLTIRRYRISFEAFFGSAAAFDLRWSITPADGALVLATALSADGTVYDGPGGTGNGSWSIVHDVCSDGSMSTACLTPSMAIDDGAPSDPMTAFSPARGDSFFVNDRIEIDGGTANEGYALISSWTASFRLQPISVPEPSSWALIATGLLPLAIVTRHGAGRARS